MTLALKEKKSEISYLKEQQRKIINNSILTTVLNSSVVYSLILNKNREILFGNSELCSFLDVSNDDLLGLKPGEVIRCENAKPGCGNSEKCQACEGRKLFLKALETNNATQGVVKVCTQLEGTSFMTIFHKKVTPLIIGEDEFFIYSLKELKKYNNDFDMNRVFLHDIMNAATGLYNTIRLMEMKNENLKNDKEMKTLEIYIKNIIDDIEFQRNLK
jgi:hypothetical protein